MDECVFCGSSDLREVKGAFQVLCCAECGEHSCPDEEELPPKKAQKTRLRNNPYSQE